MKLSWCLIWSKTLHFALVTLLWRARSDAFSSSAMAGRGQKSGSIRRMSELRVTTVQGPSVDTKPDYENIHGPLGPLADMIFLAVFRKQLAKNAKIDSSKNIFDYGGIMDIAECMTRSFPPQESQIRAQRTLRSLFPSWMPGSFAVMFSKPFPEFSARLNAWATMVAGTWLMGECEVIDVEGDGGIIAVGQGLQVKRCRFLEEAGCASTCVNACKIPTQAFFNEDMGLPLTIEPNYETYECTFSFGKTPTLESESIAVTTPCLARCPTAGALRKLHNGEIGELPASDAATLPVCERLTS